LNHCGSFFIGNQKPLKIRLLQDAGLAAQLKHVKNAKQTKAMRILASHLLLQFTVQLFAFFDLWEQASVAKSWEFFDVIA